MTVNGALWLVVGRFQLTVAYVNDTDVHLGELQHAQLIGNGQEDLSSQ